MINVNYYYRISEERRKRLQEVERELAEKRRALNELKNVEKINAQREEDLKKHQQALKVQVEFGPFIVHFRSSNFVKFI
jgi:uncharacterized membrane protein (DUF106 family)